MTVRTIDPFAYFDYASQLSGFGGDKPSPDPQYCFHTRYETVRPGRAVFRLKLSGACASQGELTIRVHAFRPDLGSAPVLTAGNRLELELEGKQDLAIAVPIHAINGVEYALYGYFSEPTNLSVDQIEAFVEEPEGGEEIEVEAPLSILAEPMVAQEAGPATGLTHHGPIERDHPVSQDCTWHQIETGGPIAEHLAHWREAVSVAALSAYDVKHPDLCGWVAGEMGATMRERLIAERFALFFHGEAPGRESGEFADFIVWPEGPRADHGIHLRWAELHSWVERLKIGGLAAIGLRYRPDAAQNEALSRNEIRQWALRLIGMGYSVAPLAFADHDALVVDQDGMAAFCLIIRRQ